MGKKLRSKDGFTLTEMLVTIVILALVGTAVAVGVSAAMRTYQDVTLKAEASMLCGTLSIEIADELRFAQNCEMDGASGNLVYDSSRFGEKAELTVVDGYITVGGKPLLSGRTYTSFRANIVSDISESQISVEITVLYNGAEIAANTLGIIPLNSN